eukprot:2950868-Amphidinium_carterae.1
MLSGDNPESVKAKRRAHSRVRRELLKEESKKATDEIDDEMMKLLEEFSNDTEENQKPPCFWYRMGNCANPNCNFSHKCTNLDVTLYEQFYTLRCSKCQKDRDMWSATSGMVKKALRFWTKGNISMEEMSKRINLVHSNRAFGAAAMDRFIRHMEGDEDQTKVVEMP